MISIAGERFGPGRTGSASRSRYRPAIPSRPRSQRGPDVFRVLDPGDSRLDTTWLSKARRGASGDFGGLEALSMGILGWVIAGSVVALIGLGWLVRAFWRCRAVIRELERHLIALGENRPIRPTKASAPGSVGRLARRFDTTVPVLQERVDRLGRDVEQLRVVLGGMAEGVIAIDARRRLLFANKSADILFGLGPSAVGRMVPELIRSPQFQEAVDATLASPETYRGEILLPRSRGVAALNPASPRRPRFQASRIEPDRSGPGLPRRDRVAPAGTDAAGFRGERPPTS